MSSQELFASLSAQLHDQRLRTLLKQVEKQFSQLKDPSQLWNSFLTEYEDFLYFENFSLAQMKLRDLLRQIQDVSKKFTSKSVVPQKTESTYIDTVKQFQQYVSDFHEFLSAKHYSHAFVECVDQFSEDMNTTFLVVFNTAKIESVTKNNLLDILQQSTTDFINTITEVSDNSSFPDQVAEIEELFQQTNQLSSDIDSIVERINETPTARILSRSTTLTLDDDINSVIDQVSANLIEISKKIKPPYSKSLLANVQRLHSVVKVPGDTMEVERMKGELKRVREMIDLLNKAGSMRSNIDVERLQGMSNDHLVYIIHSLVTEQRIPAELMKVPAGTPNDYAELYQKYKETAEYSEHADQQIQHLQAQLVALQSENQQLKITAAAASSVQEMRLDICAIDDRTEQIEQHLKHQLRDNSRSTDTRGLRRELDDLELQRADLLDQIHGTFDRGAQAELDILKKENRAIRRMLDSKIEENAELQKQIIEIAKDAARETLVSNSPPPQKAKSDISKPTKPAAIPKTKPKPAKKRAATPPQTRMRMSQSRILGSPSLMQVSKIPFRQNFQQQTTLYSRPPFR